MLPIPSSDPANENNLAKPASSYIFTGRYIYSMSPELVQYIRRGTLSRVEVGMGSGVCTSHLRPRFHLRIFQLFFHFLGAPLCSTAFLSLGSESFDLTLILFIYSIVVDKES